MGGLVRFGISLDKSLLKDFDKLINSKDYSNRSEAIRDLIRNSLVEDEWKKNKDVAGVITLVYDHHKRELISLLLDIQHEHEDLIIASQHAHLDHHNCMEAIIVKGKSENVRMLADKLRAVKAVKHGSLTLTTLGKGF